MGKTETADNAVIIDMAVDAEQNWYISYTFLREVVEPHVLIAEIIKRYLDTSEFGIKPSAIGIETVGFQKFLKDEFERECELQGIYIPIHELEPHGRSKSYRIQSLQPRWRRGQIKMPDNDLGRKVLREEVYRWTPRSLLDDFLDCTAYGHEMCRIFGYPKVSTTHQWKTEVKQEYDRKLRENREGVNSGINHLMIR